ncbi:MAG TPA: SBBP repeat-containing protein [Candidatus Binataceae bacterium]|nr:SBBP repeat-containing protein [Candidatus Binataceae bacterium]
MFLTGQGTVLALRKATALPQTHSATQKGDDHSQPKVALTTASVWINLLGARRDAQVEGIDALAGRVNYLIGNNPAQWHTNIPTYARVKYRSVYPGIDLVYYGTPQALEYDLIAAPGADPGLIRLELEGTESVRLDQAGDLVISTGAGDLTMRQPRVYQDTAAGDRVTIQAHYVMTPGAPTAGKQTVALALAEHNHQLPLVIDPEIVYSTYLGGKGDRSGPLQGFASIPSGLLPASFSDAAISLALGPGNTVFTTGLAYSSNFPATPGSFQSTNQASPNTTPNGFVAKFDTTKSGASSLVYSTYLGGKGCSTSPCTPGHDGDQGTGIAVDTSGDAYVGGLSYSDNFPNTGCGSFGTGNNHSPADNNNGFVAELNPTGSGLFYSCFVHGSDDAAVTGIAIKPGCASNCAAYATGNTRSPAGNYVVTGNAFQATNPDTNANSSGYVQVIAGGGKSLVYSSFLGGTGTPNGGEGLTRIAVDTAGRLYVTGTSFSSDYPTKNAFQSSNNGFSLGVENAVVSEIDPSASGKPSLLYSTYLGGSGLSIFLVGNFGDIGAGIALDSSNHIYVAGLAVSSNFPTNGTKKAFQPNSKAGGLGGANGFVSELDTTQAGSKQLVYSTYIGGPADLFGSPTRPGDAATDVAVDSSTGKIYLTGGATSTGFPVANTCAPMSVIGAGDQADAFVSVLNPNVTPTSQLVFSTYLGGGKIDVGGAIARDSSNHIYVAGLTFSGDFPVTKSAFQFGNNAFAAGTTNAFVTELDPSSTVCPSPFPSPSITATPRSTPTTTTKSPTPTATPTAVPATPHISSITNPVLVGGSFNIVGTHFTAGSKVNFFVATSHGSVNAGPLTPTSHTSVLLTVAVPDTISPGEGFVSVEVVNTDTGFQISNLGFALLQGSPTAGIPTLKSINGVPLAATSDNPSFATNNVETVVAQGTTVRLGGTAFDVVNGVAVDLFCACPGDKLSTFFLNPGNPNLTPTQISIFLPAKGTTNSPPTGPGSFVISNAGASKTYTKKSNAVSVPIGAQIRVLSVTQSGLTITVNGTGFSTLTVINFFNSQSGGAVNLGGIGAGGKANIPLTVLSDTKFTFAKPAHAVAGASYVQALNPPFVPFTSSGNDPGGGFTLK